MPHLRRALRHDDIPTSTISSSSIDRNSNDNGINNRQSSSTNITQSKNGGIIGGQAFYDTNQNGINDDDHLSSSYTVLPTDINIWLFTCNTNVPSINMGHYETNSSGVYTFDELDSGSYYVVVQKPEGYEFSSVWRDVNNHQPLQSSSTTSKTLQAALKQSIAQQFSSSSSSTNTTITNNVVEYSTINPEKGQTTCFTIKNNEVNMNMHFGLYRVSNDMTVPSLQPSSSSGGGGGGGDMSSNVPTIYPSYKISYRPSAETSAETNRPSVETSTMPSDNPTIQITEQPTRFISSIPSNISTSSTQPSNTPTSSNSVSNRPSKRPSLIISTRPTSRPSHSSNPSLESGILGIEDTDSIPSSKPSIESGDFDESSSSTNSPSSYPSQIPSIPFDSSTAVTDKSNIVTEETSNSGMAIGGIIFGILSFLIITIELLVWYRRRRKRRIKEQDNDINNDIVISTTSNNNEEPSPLSNESTIVHGTSTSAWHEEDIEQSNRTQDPSHRSEEEGSSKEDTSKGDTSKDTNSSKDSWFSTTVQTLWNQHYRRRGSKEDGVPSKVSEKTSSSRRREQNSDGDLTAVRVNLTSSFLSGSKKKSEPLTMSSDEHKDKLEQEMCTLTNIIEGLSKGSAEYMLLCSYLDKTIQELTIMKQDQDTNNNVVSRRGRSPPSRVHYSSSSRSGGISDSSSISSSNSGGSSFVSSTGSDSVDSVDWRQFMPKPGEQGLPDSVQDALVLVDEIQKESLSLALEDASGDHHSITETNLVTSAKHEIQSLEHELNSLSKALETYPKDGKSWQLLHSYFEKVKEELDSVRNDINVLESSGDLSSSVDSYLTNSGRNTPVDLNETTMSSNNNNLSLKDIVGIYNPNNADSLSTVHEGLDESTSSEYEKSLPSLISSSESEQDQNLSLQDIDPPVPSGSSIYTDSLDKVLLHEGVDNGTAHNHIETNPYVVSPGSSEEATVGSGNSDDSETRRIFGERRRRGDKSTRVQSHSPKRKNLLRSSGKDDQFSVASSSGWSTCDDHSSSSDVS